MEIAYSPCPNDTFLFYHLLEKTIDTGAPFAISASLHDVEELNEKAKTGFYPFTKLSFAAYFSVLEHYVLLDAGSALGRGCGPLLVRKKGSKVSLKGNSKVLVPGLMTTANLLFGLFQKQKPSVIPMRYDKIIPALTLGEADFGVIIHEERFTYEEFGLEIVQDLGEFWEETTGLPIPLGAIAGRRNLPNETLRDFERSLKKSLDLAYQGDSSMWDYIKAHSQNKSDNVIRAHIELYVNSFSKSLGEEGKAAIFTLREKAVEAGFYPKEILDHPLFLDSLD